MGKMLDARAINAEPWEPLPGMEKRRCPQCEYLYAAAPERTEPRCPSCADRGRGRGARTPMLQQEGSP